MSSKSSRNISIKTKEILKKINGRKDPMRNDELISIAGAAITKYVRKNWHKPHQEVIQSFLEKKKIESLVKLCKSTTLYQDLLIIKDDEGYCKNSRRVFATLLLQKKKSSTEILIHVVREFPTLRGDAIQRILKMPCTATDLAEVRKYSFPLDLEEQVFLLEEQICRESQDPFDLLSLLGHRDGNMRERAIKKIKTMSIDWDEVILFLCQNKLPSLIVKNVYHGLFSDVDLSAEQLFRLLDFDSIREYVALRLIEKTTKTYHLTRIVISCSPLTGAKAWDRLKMSDELECLKLMWIITTDFIPTQIRDEALEKFCQLKPTEDEIRELIRYGSSFETTIERFLKKYCL